MQKYILPKNVLTCGKKLMSLSTQSSTVTFLTGIKLCPQLYNVTWIFQFYLDKMADFQENQ